MLVMRWSEGRKNIISGCKLKAVLRTLNSFRNLAMYFAFFAVMLKFKLKRFFRLN